MSIRSQMQDKAVAMIEAAAERARRPEDLKALQQRLVAQIQNGSIPPYIGVPMVQDLTKRMTEMQQRAAQAAVGMPAPPQGAPLAQQVMAQAQQGAGVEALPSNLPQSYAPGGLVAFAEGGQVERYNGMFPEGSLIGKVQRGSFQFPEGSLLGLIQAAAAGDPEAQRVIEEERKKSAKPMAGTMPAAGYTRPGLAGDPRLIGATPPTETVGYDAERARNMALVNAPADTPAATPAAAQPAAPSIGMPNLSLPTVELPAMPTATDFTSITKNLPTEAKTAFNAARDAEEKYLRSLTEPGEQTREKRFAAREAAIEKDSAMGRALNLMSLGFGIAGSKERTLAGALGNEGRQGIAALIQGEAANRVAKERLEDARDNFEQQKIASKKGDRAAASAAGQRAADDLRAYTGLNLQAAQAGSSEAMQRAQMQQSGTLGVAQLEQSGKLGLAGLQLQTRQLQQQAAYQDKALALQEKRIAASDRATQARYAQVRAQVLSKFDTGPGMQLALQLANQYGKDWRTGKDAKSLEAQLIFKQARQAAVLEAMGDADVKYPGLNAPSSDDL